MNLHLDKDTFLAIILNISEREKIRADIIEKDYYVTLILSELSRLQSMIPAYFKGGTALYKALKKLNRFSEDIDITVEIENCNASQARSRLKKVTNKYTELQRTSDVNRESNKKGTIISCYDYKPVAVADETDILQRFGHVKVEATSFTISEPFEDLEIEPLIYTKAKKEEKEILIKEFGVKPFIIKTIMLERIFVDKILAAEFYYIRKEFGEVSKHLYDLVTLLQLEKIKVLLNNEEELIKMLKYKREEEKLRIGSELAKCPFELFQIFKELKSNKLLEKEFKHMQDIYVFNTKDMLEYDVVVSEMGTLYKVLLQIKENFEDD